MNSIVLPQSVTDALINEPTMYWVGDEPMPEYDNEDPYGHLGRPKNVVDLFWRLGYDLNNNDDFHRLADDFRWLVSERKRSDEERKKSDESRPRRFNAFVSLVAAVISAALTAVVSWFLAKH